MNTKTVGDFSEAKLLVALLKQGRVILQPWGDNQRYDFAIDEGEGRISRVQVKTGRLSPNKAVVWVDAKSFSSRGSKGYQGEVEFIGAFCPALDRVYLVPIAQIGKKGFTLRLETPKNGQRKRVLWAKDFEIPG
jgi:hypothetical protein